MKARANYADTESVRYFDTQAATYSARYDERSPAGQALRERRRLVISMLRGSAGEVLDVGCGPAVMARELVGEGWRFYGVDASAEVVRAAGPVCSALESAHVAAGALPLLPFPNARFDAVLCIGVIDRLPDADAILAELARVLRPGGTALVSFPNAASPWARWNNGVFLPAVRALKVLLRAGGRRSSTPDLTRPAPLWSSDRAKTAIRRYVGTVTEIAYFHAAVIPPPLDRLFPRLAMRLATRLEKPKRERLRRLGIGFIVKATRTTSDDPQGIER